MRVLRWTTFTGALIAACFVQGSTAGAFSQSVPVLGAQAWTNTGIDVPEGYYLHITAAGRIKIAGSDPGKSPDGSTYDWELPSGSCAGQPVATEDATCNSLVGRIGAGDVFPVGYGTSFVSTASGRLYLGVNDTYLGDNSGAWSTVVTVEPAVPVLVPKTLAVPASRAWTNTEIDVTPGETVDISASGRIRIAASDPGKNPDGTTTDGDVPGTSCDTPPWITVAAACHSLIGRIGNGPVFPVGLGTTFVATVGGRLLLGVNDNYFPDNSGAWTAVVQLSRADVRLLAPVPAGVELAYVTHGYDDPQPGGTGRDRCEIASARDHCANQRYGLDIVPGDTWDGAIVAPAPGTPVKFVRGAGGDCLLFRLEDGANLSICHFNPGRPTVAQLDAPVARGELLGWASSSWIHLSLDARWQLQPNGDYSPIERIPANDDYLCTAMYGPEGYWNTLAYNKQHYWCPMPFVGKYALEGKDLLPNGLADQRFDDYFPILSTNATP